MIYVLVVLGTYLVSSFDILYMAVPGITEGHNEAAHFAAPRLPHFVSQKTQELVAPRERSFTVPATFHGVHHYEDERLKASVKALKETWSQADGKGKDSRTALTRCLS